jgi:hypothetical protein
MLTSVWSEWLQWINSIDWTPDAVTAAAAVVLAALTFVLAFGTFLLALAMRRLVRGGERNAERQLRAYVHGLVEQHPAVEDAMIAASPEVGVLIRNYGQTPAHDLCVSMSVGVLEYPPPREMPEAKDSIAREGKISFPPGGEMRIFIQPSEPINAEIRRMIERSGNPRFYVWGKLTYTDAFNRKRETQFQWMYGGNATWYKMQWCPGSRAT